MSQSDFVTRGQALVSAGQYQEAVKVCRLGLLGRPTTVEGRVVLGQALLALKRYDEVLAEMRVALELDHASTTAQVLKGEALLRKGDAVGAVEVLGKLRSLGVADAHVAGLLAEAERLAGPAAPVASAFLAHDPMGLDQGTKNYPNYQADGPDSEDGNGEFTKPTSIAMAAPKKRASDAMPSPAVLAVGDRSGTVEVDPDLEGVEVRASDDDLDELAPPPSAQGRPAKARPVAAKPAKPVAAKPAAKARPVAAKPAGRRGGRPAQDFKEEVSTVELDDEILDIAETLSPAARVAPMPGPAPAPARRDSGREAGREAVRKAVKMPSGPIDIEQAPPQPQLAQRIINQPHVMSVSQPPVNPRSAIAAALPTAAAAPMPAPPMPMGQGIPPHLQATQMPMGPSTGPSIGGIPPHLQATQVPVPRPGLPGVPAMPAAPALQVIPYQPPNAAMQLPAHLQSVAAAARPTLAINPGPPPQQHPPQQHPQHPPQLNQQQLQSAAVVDALFNGPELATPPPGALGGAGSGGVPAPAYGAEPSSPSKPLRTGMRKRSRLQILVWIVIGAVVIGGGVFAGFQIRAIRLRKQIVAARDRAVDAAKADTWQGWLNARDSLFSIAQASATVDNKAALARARAVLTYEFGDPPNDAKATIDVLAGQSSPDLDLAVAYLALASNDVKKVRELAERAKQAAANDAAGAYVAGQAALLTGDLKLAVEELRRAHEREPRPIYAVGLARALGAASAWDEALTTLDGRSAPPAGSAAAGQRGSSDKLADNPAAIITKAMLLASAGRAVGGPANELRVQLGKLIAEGAKPVADQPRGVSPLQVALADLALAQIDFARNDLGAARADYRASLALQVNDQRYAEELTDTVYAIGELEAARKAAVLTLEQWPTSRRARTTLAQIWLAMGQPSTALELFTKTPDAAAWPKGLTVRGLAHQATGDLDGARADYDAALKKLPTYEPALVARAWLDLAVGDLDDARQRIEPRFNARTATAAMAAVWAELQRLAGDAAARDKAKTVLERYVGGGPSPDAIRVQLELARIYRDLGDVRAAKTAYAEASRTGNLDARLESGLLQIEDSDPDGGHATLEQLLKDLGDRPTAQVLLETARARALTGDHPGAADLLARAEKAANVTKWQLERERGRLALRKSDTTGAAQALVRALEGCGSDLDTFLLAADTVSTDEKQAALAQKLTSLVPTRLKGRPEADIIAGKLDLAAGNRQEQAEKAYNAAREGLVKEKASQRRRAQAAYGLAAIAYFKRDDPTAKSMLELVMVEDPSIYSAYLFAAEIAKPKAPKDALKLAQQSAKLNPDSLDAWKLVGTLASQLGDREQLRAAVARVNDIAPGSEVLRQLQALK